MKKHLILAFLCCLCGTLFAQTKISGRVVSAEDGQPLPFVTVTVKGVAAAVAQTNDDGKYTITIPGSNKILVFSYIGFISQEIDAGSRSIVDVLMTSDAVNIDEVIVTAFGTSTRKTFTGSAAQVSGEKLTARPVMNAAQAIAGMTSGVQLTSAAGQPGSTPTIRIRGIGSVNAGNDPLYVVDGAPLAGSLNDIPAEDIASITVLKDAASSALYGSRAANGVVMITTKRGKMGDKSSVNISSKVGFTMRATPEQETLNSQEWMELMWETYRNGLVTTGVPLSQANIRASSAPKNASGTYTDGLISKIQYNPYNVPADQMIGTDGKLNPSAKLLWADDLNWMKAVEQQGVFQEYAISGSGGSEKSSYYASATYNDTKGFVMKTSYKRITARASADFKPNNWFKAGFSVNGALKYGNYTSADGGSGYANPFYFARNIAPIYPIYVHDQSTGAYLYDVSGNKYWDWGGRTELGSPARPYSAGRHIVAEMLYNTNDGQFQVLGGNAYIEFSPLKGLTIKATSSADLTAELLGTYTNKIVGDGAPAGRANRTNYFYTSWNNIQTANYSTAFGEHTINILLGHESNSWERNYLYGFRQGQVMDGNTELINFTTTNSLTSYTDTRRLEGYLSNADYTFKNKYLFKASYRRDGSSKFHKDNRWGNFWSLSGGWILSRESFMQTVKWVDHLKVRVSYGTVGNDDLGLYPYMALYSIGYPNAAEAGTFQTSLANNDLQWEVNRSADIALEFGLFGRLSGSVEFFNRVSSNLLFAVPLPLSSGAAIPSATSATINQNIGTMFNRGVEMQLEWDVIKKKDIGWQLTANATTIKNEITKLPENNRENGIVDGTKKLMEGHSRYDYWLREWKGVDPADGNTLYRLNTQSTPYSPTNKEHRIQGGDTLTTNVNAARYHFNGSAFPKVYGSLSSNLRYKRFSFNFMFVWSVGGQMYDGTYNSFMVTDTQYGNQKHVDLKKRWQNPGDITDVPRLDDQVTTNNNAANSDRWLISSSYLNLQSISLSYRIPNTIKGTRLFDNASIFVSAENLFQISARKGMNAAEAMTGVTSNVYPPNKAIILGLNIKL